MCDTCNKLQTAIDNAIRDGDQRKERIMRILLTEHKDKTCHTSRLHRALFGGKEVVVR